MKKRLLALPALLLTTSVLISSSPAFADPPADQGLPPGGEQQLQPMQPVMATPANYYPQGGAPQAYPPQGAMPSGGNPQQYGAPQYQQNAGYPQQGYPQGAPYQAGVSEAVPGQQMAPGQQMSPGQMPPLQQGYQQQQAYQPQQGFQQQSPYEMQEQAIQKGHMQNRNDLDKYNPPPDVPNAAPDPSYRGEVSKGPGVKGVVGKAAKILGRTTQAAAPYAASFLVTTAAYKMANRNGYNRGYNNGYGGYGYGMPMGGYGMPMGGMPGMGMYGMPGMGMGIPMYGMPSF